MASPTSKSVKRPGSIFMALRFVGKTRPRRRQSRAFDDTAKFDIFAPLPPELVRPETSTTPLKDKPEPSASTQPVPAIVVTGFDDCHPLDEVKPRRRPSTLSHTDAKSTRSAGTSPHPLPEHYSEFLETDNREPYPIRRSRNLRDVDNWSLSSCSTWSSQTSANSTFGARRPRLFGRPLFPLLRKRSRHWRPTRTTAVQTHSGSMLFPPPNSSRSRLPSKSLAGSRSKMAQKSSRRVRNSARSALKPHPKASSGTQTLADLEPPITPSEQETECSAPSPPVEPESSQRRVRRVTLATPTDRRSNQPSPSPIAALRHSHTIPQHRPDQYPHPPKYEVTDGQDKENRDYLVLYKEKTVGKSSDPVTEWRVRRRRKERKPLDLASTGPLPEPELKVPQRTSSLAKGPIATPNVPKAPTTRPSLSVHYPEARPERARRMTLSQPTAVTNSATNSSTPQLASNSPVVAGSSPVAPVFAPRAVSVHVPTSRPIPIKSRQPSLPTYPATKIDAPDAKRLTEEGISRASAFAPYHHATPISAAVGRHKAQPLAIATSSGPVVTAQPQVWFPLTQRRKSSARSRRSLSQVGAQAGPALNDESHSSDSEPSPGSEHTVEQVQYSPSSPCLLPPLPQLPSLQSALPSALDHHNSSLQDSPKVSESPTSSGPPLLSLMFLRRQTPDAFKFTPQYFDTQFDHFWAPDPSEPAATIPDQAAPNDPSASQLDVMRSPRARPTPDGNGHLFSRANPNLEESSMLNLGAPVATWLAEKQNFESQLQDPVTSVRPRSLELWHHRPSQGFHANVDADVELSEDQQLANQVIQWDSFRSSKVRLPEPLGAQELSALAWPEPHGPAQLPQRPSHLSGTRKETPSFHGPHSSLEAIVDKEVMSLPGDPNYSPSHFVPTTLEPLTSSFFESDPTDSDEKDSRSPLAFQPFLPSNSAAAHQESLATPSDASIFSVGKACPHSSVFSIVDENASPMDSGLPGNSMEVAPRLSASSASASSVHPLPRSPSPPLTKLSEKAQGKQPDLNISTVTPVASSPPHTSPTKAFNTLEHSMVKVSEWRERHLKLEHSPETTNAPAQPVTPMLLPPIPPQTTSLNDELIQGLIEQSLRIQPATVQVDIPPLITALSQAQAFSESQSSHLLRTIDMVRFRLSMLEDQLRNKRSAHSFYETNKPKMDIPVSQPTSPSANATPSTSPSSVVAPPQSVTVGDTRIVYQAVSPATSIRANQRQRRESAVSLEGSDELYMRPSFGHTDDTSVFEPQMLKLRKEPLASPRSAPGPEVQPTLPVVTKPAGCQRRVSWLPGSKPVLPQDVSEDHESRPVTPVNRPTNSGFLTPASPMTPRTKSPVNLKFWYPIGPGTVQDKSDQQRPQFAAMAPPSPLSDHQPSPAQPARNVSIKYTRPKNGHCGLTPEPASHNGETQFPTSLGESGQMSDTNPLVKAVQGPWVETNVKIALLENMALKSQRKELRRQEKSARRARAASQRKQGHTFVTPAPRPPTGTLPRLNDSPHSGDPHRAAASTAARPSAPPLSTQRPTGTDLGTQCSKRAARSTNRRLSAPLSAMSAAFSAKASDSNPDIVPVDLTTSGPRPTLRPSGRYARPAVHFKLPATCNNAPPTSQQLLSTTPDTPDRRSSLIHYEFQDSAEISPSFNLDEAVPKGPLHVTNPGQQTPTATSTTRSTNSRRYASTKIQRSAQRMSYPAGWQTTASRPQYGQTPSARAGARKPLPPIPQARSSQRQSTLVPQAQRPLSLMPELGPENMTAQHPLRLPLFHVKQRS
ncbi:hypothetical protein H4R35_002968 [Dimargaris xerosporica]|nr:hypothetical protein H4R35_002968 [Dimargaris xerosporica]